MNQKTIGILILIAGVFLLSFTFFTKDNEDRYIENIIKETGSCFLSDGTCLHDDRNLIYYFLGSGLSIALIVFGFYVSFIDKTQDKLRKHQIEVSNALLDSKKNDLKKEQIDAFLSAFSEDEKKILKIIIEEDGITQSTLRYKTDYSKTALSLFLKNLEERNIISRIPHKKTNKLFMKKLF
jgi:DNA-binding MarR family transcriptional regulator